MKHPGQIPLPVQKIRHQLRILFLRVKVCTAAGFQGCLFLLEKRFWSRHCCILCSGLEPLPPAVFYHIFPIPPQACRTPPEAFFLPHFNKRDHCRSQQRKEQESQNFSERQISCSHTEKLHIPRSQGSNPEQRIQKRIAVLGRCLLKEKAAGRIMVLFDTEEEYAQLMTDFLSSLSFWAALFPPYPYRCQEGF